jgi:CRP-like cAMP-binding protein
MMNSDYFSDAARHPMIRRLRSITDIPRVELDALMDVKMKVVEIDADIDIVREGERPTQCVLLLEGYACRYKLLDFGKRQILAFHITGDLPDLQSYHLEVMDHSLCTLSPAKVAFLSHQTIDYIITTYPKLAAALWRSTLVDASIFRQWIAGVGRRLAHERIAHLICELVVRHRAVGLAQDFRFNFPVTQAELGDATGLSVVHVNRVVRDLRSMGLISLAGGYVAVRDWARLKKTARFDASYLHVRGGEP